MTYESAQTVLVVEDDRALALIEKKILGEQGYTVECVTAGTDALERINQGGIDLMVLDHVLSDMLGLDLVTQLGPLVETLPIIVVTAHGDERLAVDMLKHGVADYVVKDANLEFVRALPRLARNAISQFSLRKQNRELMERLRESEEKYRRLFEAESDAILIISGATLMIVDANTAAPRLYGYTRGELMELRAPELCASRAHLTNALKKAVSQDDGSRFLHDKHRRKDGSVFPVEVMLGSFTLGMETMLFAVVRDVSERQQVEEALRTASRMEATSTLAGGIAHEFNNLMASALGYANVARELLDDAHPAKEILGEIEVAAKEAGDLAHEMLAFARGGRFHPRRISLNEVITGTALLQKSSLPAHIQVVRVLANDLWPVEADATQMHQLIMNLLINAVEAIEVPGRIEIGTQNIECVGDGVEGLAPGRYACLTVSDTGAGMAPKVLSRVFEPFFTTKFSGRGLGLAAVYGIVQNHGGHITACSEPGQGSSFTVYLPAAEDYLQGGKEGGSRAPAKHKTILVIDDERMVRNVAQRILQREGFSVLVAEDGDEGVALASKHEGEIHAALLDLTMPRMSGAEALPLLREARPKMKVIVCSGFEFDAEAREMLDAGAHIFLQKPFRPRALLEALGKVLAT